MPRLASLCLPNLAIDRIRRAARPEPARRSVRESGDRVLTGPGGGWRPGARWAREAQPQDFSIRGGGGALVTAMREGNRNLIAAACPAARSLGLEPGMALTKARILVRDLEIRPADPEGDAAWLARLGLFAARRWTPRAAVSGVDGLWLDFEGVSHLFGGEQAFCERILAFCRRLGMAACIAVAGTAGTAHALARFGGKALIRCPTGGEAAAIAAMPPAALRLDAEALATASRLGIERIGALAAMPRAPLQRRFGSRLLTRLDQALGRAAEPIDPIVPEEPPRVTVSLLEPIATAEAIEETGGEGLRRLVPLLAQAGLGVRRLALICERVDRDAQSVTIDLARATRDSGHLLRLLRARIETIEPGFGIERLHLVANRVEPLGASSPRFRGEGDRGAERRGGGTPPPPFGRSPSPANAGEEYPDLALLIDRLAARLGSRRLHRLSALESDIAERSVGRADLLSGGAGWPPWPRPVRLLSPPEPVEQVLSVLPDGAPLRFRWRGRSYRVAAADGPERIFGEWWRRPEERAAVRDYFQVEDEEGARFWLYRRGDGEISAAGDLSWHMHGVFG